jgi:hypothetical protein
MPAPTTTERREARFAIAADVLTEDVQTHARKTGKVENISGSGCFVRTPDPWITWTRIRLWIVYHGQQFEAEASVVHAGGRGMGVSFEAITPANLEVLTAWLQTLPT